MRSSWPGVNRQIALLPVFCCPCVLAQEDASFLFAMSLEQLFELNVSSATKRSQPLNQIPATVYVYTQDDFARYGFSDLKDVLKYTCGIEYGDAHSWLQGGQRGFTGTWSQTRILIDGRGGDEISRNQAHIAHQYPLYNIKRVEVIQGPASSLYGADVFVGLINIVTQNSDNSAPGQKLSLSYGAGEDGLASRQIDYSLIHLAREWGFSLHASYLNLDDPDYSDFVLSSEYSQLNRELRAEFLHGGFPYKDDNQGFNLMLDYQWEISDSDRLVLGLDQRNSRDGGGIENPELIYTNFQETEDQTRLYASYQKVLASGDLLSLDYQYIRERTVYDFNLRSLDLGKPPPLLTFSQEWSRQNTLTVQYDLDGQAWGNYLILGAGYKKLEQAKPEFQLSAFEATEPFLDHRVNSLFIQDQQSLWQQKVFVTLGARYDHSDLYGSVNTVRGALQYNISGQSSVKLLYGEAFREPNLLELSTNKDLAPADMQTTELVYDARANDNLSYKFSLYHSKATDIIVEDRQSTDGINRNLGKKEADGAELHLQWQLSRYQGFFWWTYVDVSPQLDVARHKAAAGVTRVLNSQWQLSAVGKYTSDLDTQAFNAGSLREKVGVPGYHSVDITLKSKDISLLNFEELSVNVSIKNVFNHRNFYSNPRGPDPIKFLDQGRSFDFQVNFSF